ncbi:hypothetical protein GCM10011371_19210 [Novosphingobium marinum]|uniref:Uncharacterized protein (DUF885 family) n=1 Tax=Novosphingobium marinum TaxID=1514948 RepID=A0A7Z0BUA1_9SPHN|nr:DUF885 domain-containing protein [Novosphingobium marinum]NYH96034.1 uncharacterized protein (DUF885 family) [Novosphingobium marinum]GGC31899.1 hypothetical protein GCM10011371_19210 [Novosphingobium marinum]
MTRLRSLLLCAAALPLVPGVAHADHHMAGHSATAAEQSEHDKLFAIFEAADEAQLRLNPISGIFRGDMRYADRLGDYLTDEYNDASRAQAQANLDALQEIDKAKLSYTDKLAYDVFAYNMREELSNYTPDILALTEVRPINHFFGFHTYYPSFASGSGAAPFKTVEDYENNLSRHEDYVKLIDRSIAKFREGMDSGVLETKLTIGNVIEQLETQAAQDLEESPYWGPVKEFPEDFSEADKTRLTAEYRDSIADVYAVNQRLLTFLKDEYYAKARDSVGLSQMKGGEALYRQMIEQTTTLPLSPDYLHNLGLSEVERITAEMEKVKDEVGFDGTLQEFFDHIRTDPQFKPESREALTERYYEIGREVDALIPQYFSTVPKSALEIRPYEPFREKHQAGGSYQGGSPDGERPGVFYFNAYDLPSRTTPGEVTLYLHEGAPGHHFQISLAQENEALPAFMRFGGNTAFVEGWALYSETLGYPMGLFDDPYSRFGTLDDEMLRAMRLVVDTGLHSKGWTREQAIKYMLDNSSMGETDATAEVERYIAIPSQALAYKVGALKIQELRGKAQEALGDDFDIREFHEQVLGTGALPLPVLEQKIDDWIASKQA